MRIILSSLIFVFIYCSSFAQWWEDEEEYVYVMDYLGRYIPVSIDEAKKYEGNTHYAKYGLYDVKYGNLTQAFLSFQKALKNQEDSSAVYFGFGNIYRKLGNYEKALTYYQQACDYKKKEIGEKHHNYILFVNNIGDEFFDAGRYEDAIVYYRCAIEAYKKLFEEYPDEYVTYTAILGIIANKCVVMGYYEDALKYYQEEYEYDGICYNKYGFGVCFYKTGNIKEAINLNCMATNEEKTNLIHTFSTSISEEREKYWKSPEYYFNTSPQNIFQTNIIYSCHAKDDTLAAITSYNTELLTKGILLTSETSIIKAIMESEDSTLIVDFNHMRDLTLELIKEQENDDIKFDFKLCKKLRKEIDALEKSIMERCNKFADIMHFMEIEWKEVQDSMKPNDVAIEFTNATEGDSTIYAAIVLTKDMKTPVFVPLFEKNEMRKLMRGILPVKSDIKDDDETRGATSVSAKKQGIYESTGLYKLIWKPLEKYFPENPSIYFAPSGMLHQIAIEYAPTNQMQTVSDKYEIYRVSSTRALAMNEGTKLMKSSVFYGGVYYDSDTTTMKHESNRFATRSIEENYVSFADLNRDENRGSLNYLPGTKTEVENIVGTLKKKKKIKTTLYEGSQANEESFKALSGEDISVLHIATHGFFLPTDKKLSGDQALIQSGLLLSGANYAWQNKPLPEGVEDGILTAKEISFMDLRKTDLVVLSACQTALGEITGEGVFGLQRGFKKAGVHTIIMSLWSVDDNATRLMMTEFYSNLIKGMTKREAFLKAQRTLQTTSGFENPKFWAAFIMLDGNE